MIFGPLGSLPLGGVRDRVHVVIIGKARRIDPTAERDGYLTEFKALHQTQVNDLYSTHIKATHQTHKRKVHEA
jgi:hypothetical protein